MTPVVADPTGVDGRLLLDASGAEIGRFLLGDRAGRPTADLFTLAHGVPVEAAAEVVQAELAGWRISVPEPFARQLVAAGGRPRRHGHVMSRDLRRDPAPAAWLEAQAPDGVRLTPVDRPALDLADACHAAFPPGHPDYPEIPSPEQPELELEDIISGRLMGALLPCSGLAVAAGGAVVGAVLVNRTAREPPFGGPWILQVFRRPDAPGVGGALLRRALALATRDGLPAVGLAVTHDNPAMRLYARLGFEDVLESVTVEL